MAKTIITLGREYCTGGRYIAKDVARALGIKLYDKELITMAAKNSGLSEEAVAASEKRHTHSLLYSLYTMGNDLPLGDQVFILQSRIIKQLADEGPCVIVGRCYIYLDCRETGLPAEIAVWSQKLSRRHFSIGADGIICICPPLTADGDATMRMFNADGSEGKMCGNGVRCVAQFLYTHGVPKDVIEIDTLMAGRKTLHRKGEGLWQAEMGHFSAMADTLPAVGLGAGPLVHAPLTAAGKTWDAACISTGNPHCIIEWPDCDTLPTGHALAAIGPEFEHHPAFPEGVNTEFVYIESPTSVVMRVWERGSGETFACGTGSCATVAALVLRGVCPRNVPVDVHLLGGILSITITADDNILMTGPAETAFVGCVEV